MTAEYIYVLKNSAYDGKSFEIENTLIKMLTKYSVRAVYLPFSDTLDISSVRKGICACRALLAVIPSCEHNDRNEIVAIKEAVDAGKDIILISDKNNEIFERFKNFENISRVFTDTNEKNILGDIFTDILCKYKGCFENAEKLQDSFTKSKNAVKNSISDDAKQAILYAVYAWEKNPEAILSLSHKYLNEKSEIYEPARAYRWLTRGLESGDLDCAVELGKCCLMGLGCDTSEKRAFRIFSEVAEKKHSYGLFYKGLCYYRGSGTSEDMYEAEKCFLEAIKVAKENNTYCPEAEYMVGLCRKKSADTYNAASCYEYFKASASHGYSLAFLELGDLYSNKDFSKYDLKKAFECYEKSITNQGGENNDNLNPSYGYFKLGCMYFFGYGCKKDEKAAFDCFIKGSTSKDYGCIYCLGICFEHGYGCDVNYRLSAALYAMIIKNDSKKSPFYANALNNLGGMFLSGLGVPKNPRIAYKLFSKAFEYGNSDAACRLGICLDSGTGCTKDKDKSLSMLIKAADMGSSYACILLSDYYSNCENDLSVTDKAKISFEYCKRAANLGNAEGMYLTAMHLKEGNGVKKNDRLSYSYLTESEKKGYALASIQLADCFFSGIGTIRNYKEAFNRYILIVGSGINDSFSYYRLGICYLCGLGVEASQKDAFLYFSKASESGNTESTFILGDFYMFGTGVDKDEQKAVEYYLCAAKNDHIYSLCSLAQCYENGIGINQDETEALRLYRKAADLDNAEGMFNCGRCFYFGIGTEKNPAVAGYYFLKAARKNNISSMLYLGDLLTSGKTIEDNTYTAKAWYIEASKSDIEWAVDKYTVNLHRKKLLKRELDAKPEAQYKLGTLLMTKGQHSSGNEYTLGYRYIANAASMGNADAIREITKLYKFTQLINKPTSIFKKDAEEDDSFIAEAMNNLGNSFYYGKSYLKKDNSACARCYEISANMNNIDAMYNYGWCLRHGYGIHENDILAAKWLKKAADFGNANAAYSYGLCCEEGAGTGIKNKREAVSYYRKAAELGHRAAEERYYNLLR